MPVFSIHVLIAFVISTLFAFTDVALALGLPDSILLTPDIQLNTEIGLSALLNFLVVLSMASFVYANCKRRIRDAGSMLTESDQVRIFSIIDGVYYLGFVITLIAIIYGLGFGGNGDGGIETLIQQNAIAISSTATALICRTLLCQVFESEFEKSKFEETISMVQEAQQAKLELLQLAQAARRLKEDMEKATAAMSETAANSAGLDRLLQKVSQNSARAYTEQMGEGVQKFIRETDAFSKKALDSYEKALVSWNDLTEMTLKVAKLKLDEARQDKDTPRSTPNQPNASSSESSERQGFDWGGFRAIFRRFFS